MNLVYSSWIHTERIRHRTRRFVFNTPPARVHRSQGGCLDHASRGILSSGPALQVIGDRGSPSGWQEEHRHYNPLRVAHAREYVAIARDIATARDLATEEARCFLEAGLALPAAWAEFRGQFPRRRSSPADARRPEPVGEAIERRRRARDPGPVFAAAAVHLGALLVGTPPPSSLCRPVPGTRRMGWRAGRRMLQPTCYWRFGGDNAARSAARPRSGEWVLSPEHLCLSDANAARWPGSSAAPGQPPGTGAQ